jgi:hypothetical protein
MVNKRRPLGLWVFDALEWRGYDIEWPEQPGIFSMVSISAIYLLFLGR